MFLTLPPPHIQQQIRFPKVPHNLGQQPFLILTFHHFERGTDNGGILNLGYDRYDHRLITGDFARNSRKYFHRKTKVDTELASLSGFVCKNFDQQHVTDLKTAEKNVFVMFHNERGASCFGILNFLLKSHWLRLFDFSPTCVLI